LQRGGARCFSRYARPVRARASIRCARRRVCAAALLLVLTCFALSPAAALATSIEGGNAFNELAQKAQETTPTSTEATTSTSGETKESSGSSNKTIFIGVAAAAVVLLAVAFVIVRDARRVAPAGPEDFSEARASRDAAARHRNRRAKARAARRQRKKNR
jgi:hypothetical protein